MTSSRRKESSSWWVTLAGIVVIIVFVLNLPAEAQQPDKFGEITPPALPATTGRAALLFQEAEGKLEEAHTIDPNDFGVFNPTRLAFSPAANIFFVTEANATSPTTITQFTPFEKLAGAVDLSGLVNDPINMSFDSHGNRLLLFDPATEELLEFKAKPDGTLDPSNGTVDRRFQAARFGFQNPKGMTVDPATGDVVILDRGVSQLVRIKPDPQGGLEDEAALRDGRVSRVNLNPAQAANSRGVAINPGNGHFYYLSPSCHLNNSG